MRRTESQVKIYLRLIYLSLFKLDQPTPSEKFE